MSLLDRPHTPTMRPANKWWRVRRYLTRPIVLFVVVIVILTIIWSGNGVVDLDLNSPEVRSTLKDLFQPDIVRGMKFLPASNNKIHYVGRWTTAPNRLRVDGTFPGVYFDLNVTNTTSVMLSIHNAKDNGKATNLVVPDQAPLGQHNSEHYSFSAASRLRVSAPPVSLLALIDEKEYVIMPNATGLVSIVMKELDANTFHTLRVIAPMTDNPNGAVQVDGLWLDEGGLLLAVEGSVADTVHDEMDDFDAESEEVGKKHRLGLSRLLLGHDASDITLKKHGFDPEEESHEDGELKRRKKVVEIVTDAPAYANEGFSNSIYTQTAGMLAGVSGWDYLLGEMFGVDHVSTSVEGMCMMQNCVNGTGTPHSLADVFFRSGPVDSPHFEHPWPFSSYVPDVLIFNVGASDYNSMTAHASEYDRPFISLYGDYEASLISLIKAVRAIAYPTHPATIEMLRLGVESFAEDNAPATIPIFVMRPLRGELEHASQNVVRRLREEGDRSVFWVDTSGWLDFDGLETTNPDVVEQIEEVDDEFGNWRQLYDPPRYHLTEQGHTKVAIYLHMHVCRYLAKEEESCAFLPPEVYQGSVFDPSVATFERYIENEKERQMKEIFWTEEDDEDKSKDPGF